MHTPCVATLFASITSADSRDPATRPPFLSTPSLSRIFSLPVDRSSPRPLRLSRHTPFFHRSIILFRAIGSEVRCNQARAYTCRPNRSDSLVQLLTRLSYVITPDGEKLRGGIDVDLIDWQYSGMLCPLTKRYLWERALHRNIFNASCHCSLRTEDGVCGVGCFVTRSFVTFDIRALYFPSELISKRWGKRANGALKSNQIRFQSR